MPKRYLLKDFFRLPNTLSWFRRTEFVLRIPMHSFMLLRIRKNMVTFLCAGRARSAIPAITMVHFQNGAQKKIVFGPASWCQIVFIGPFGKVFATKASPAPHSARYNLDDIRAHRTFLFFCPNPNQTTLSEQKQIGVTICKSLPYKRDVLALRNNHSSYRGLKIDNDEGFLVTTLTIEENWPYVWTFSPKAVKTSGAFVRSRFLEHGGDQPSRSRGIGPGSSNIFENNNLAKTFCIHFDAMI